ncbi:tRNA-dihydrouridine synthase [Geoglobus acetivorans]|uniref:tRNA-dihydrouridine synthase n=1 Tax=Geoglobus acetivorans TaxID=565033 RepID=A0ABZ3H4T6_GEOAI|nr:tRNA-dihydrouridine synthase [Geoglobus acetivorans]
MIFPNRLALSAMAGINDWKFISRFDVGFGILGGFNADKKSNEAALKVVQRGRKEFVFGNPVKEIEHNLKMLEDFGGIVGINVRAFSDEGYADVSKLAGEYGAILEINAHCRQKEFTEIGCGQALLYEQERLAKIVERTSKFAEVSVKIRGGLDIDYLGLSSRIFESGAAMIHLDAMIPGGKADLKLVELISGLGNVVGNNSVRSAEDARKMIDAGARLVSIARGVLEDERIFDRLLEDELLASKVEVR